ncbi:uncharacterized protein [Rutidosis leptorrhynchoides]|uniref:uncharacterized protein n=1 Tax=Rutidosis leptorrhynchoides TaxID=125765 RepID=UPI003A99AA15
MNLVSINIGGGVKFIQKQKWIRGICNDNNISVLGIQETKLTRLDLFVVKSLWGNMQFDVAISSARGRSGGLLTIWDPSSFKKIRIISMDNVLIVEGIWLATSSNCYLVNIYAPQGRSQKVQLWHFIKSFMSANSGNYLLFGDFNATRYAHDHLGTMFCSRVASDLNNFISDCELFDIPLGGRRYTRMNKTCTSMSKLDRLLVNNGALDLFPNIHGLILPNLWSDHCPIMLTNESFDYGPHPFKLFNSWFKIDGFEAIVHEAWNEYNGGLDINPFIDFKNKLKHVKTRLKAWKTQNVADRSIAKKNF